MSSEDPAGERTTRKQWRRRLVLWLLAAFLLVAGGGAFLFSAAMWTFRAEDFRHMTGLRPLGLALRMYAADDYYPPLSAKAGHLVFDMERLYPEYISDASILISPADPIASSGELTPAFCFEHSSYLYVGYKVWDDETVEAFADAYRKRLAAGTGFSDDLPVRLPIERLTRLDGKLRRYGMISEAESRELHVP